MTFLSSLTGDIRFGRYGYACGHPLASHYYSRTSSPASYFNRNAERLFTPAFYESCPRLHAESFVGELLEKSTAQNLLDEMLYVDSKTWLPDDLLVKADKITMANSIELRVPMLDHHVLEFAASLPSEFKVREKQTKRLLKAAFADVLPQEILTRKKAGFPVPYNSWFRGELRSQVEEVLLSEEALSRGFFKPEAISHLVCGNAAHGRFGPELFCLLVIELWHRVFIDQSLTQFTEPYLTTEAVLA
jgi:asparagine synthase (glutamine-hydrolysing)